MKLIATLALSILSFSAFSQASRIGFESGVVGSFTTAYTKDAQPVKFYKNWQRYNFINSVYLRRETKDGWSFQMNVAYVRDKVFQNNQSLFSNIAEYSGCIQHRLNPPGDKFECYFGLSYIKLISSGYYTGYYSTKYNWTDNLIGFNWLANCFLSRTVALTFNLSTKVSLDYQNQKLSKDGATLSVYDEHYDKPNLYYSCMLGISYMFNK